MESYAEYNATCDKCNKQVLEVIEYMNVEEFDDECGVCPHCRKLFCKQCVVLKDDEIYCPYCKGKLIECLGASPYDLIQILQHDCQPFKKKEA